MAVSCDQDVEVVAERTEWDTVYATPAGLTRVDTSATAVRTAVNGLWEPIDTSVVETDGGLSVAAPAMKMTFAGGPGDQPLARIVRDGHELTFDVPFELTEPVVEGSRVTYPQILEGVDLVLSVHEDGTGFSEVLRVESPEAAANPVLAELSFPVTTSDDLSVVADKGGFGAVDEAGERVFTSPTPLMWDSSAPTLDDPVPARSSRSVASGPSVPEHKLVSGGATSEDRVQGPLGADAVSMMPATVDEGSVTIEPDLAMLENPETQWPVFIDPSVSGSRNAWTLIRSAVPDTVAGFNFDGDAGLGLCDPGATSACTRSNDKHRLIWHFTGLNAVGSMTGADVVSATFAAVGTHSWSCTASGVEAWAVAGIGGWTTWNSNAGSWTLHQQSVSVAHKASCGNVRWIEFNVTGGAKHIADHNSSTLTIGLKASDEGSMAGGWKRYRNDATLSVTYNRAPAEPTGLRTDPATTCTQAAYIRDATPTLYATFADPDGGNVSASFDVHTAGARVWNTPFDSASMSGSEHWATTPALTDGKTYTWYTRGKDPQGRLGPVAEACSFTVDITRPNKLPGVAPVAGHDGVYPEDAVSGGVGKNGEFQFSNGGVSDVVSYNYSFNGDGLGSSKTVAAGGRVPFTASAPGSQRLYVQSVDRAGNTSDVRLYRFSVDFPELDGFWRMDEGAGTSAGSAAGTAGSLAVSGSAQWVDGPLAEFGSDPSDRALRFDSSADAAQSAGPVLDTAGSYTVSAMVKLERADERVAAVSQDGQFVSGFKLGHRVDPACPTGTGTCWALWAPPVDTASPTATSSLSPVPVKVNEWVHLTGVRDANAGTLTLWVCEWGSPDNPGLAEPVRAAQVPFAAAGGWSAGGPLQVGRAQTNGAPADHWPGAIDDVRVYNGVALGTNEIRDLCLKQAA